MASCEDHAISDEKSSQVPDHRKKRAGNEVSRNFGSKNCAHIVRPLHFPSLEHQAKHHDVENCGLSLMRAVKPMGSFISGALLSNFMRLLDKACRSSSESFHFGCFSIAGGGPPTLDRHNDTESDVCHSSKAFRTSVKRSQASRSSSRPRRPRSLRGRCITHRSALVMQSSLTFS